MASRDLKDLSPQMQVLAKNHFDACKQVGIDLLIYCTYRSPKEQDELYACGRTLGGAKVTNCRGGQSKHNNEKDGKPSALAYDCVPLKGGKPMWGDAALYARVGQLGESVGLSWAGRWNGSLKETAHFEA